MKSDFFLKKNFWYESNVNRYESSAIFLSLSLSLPPAHTHLATRTILSSKNLSVAVSPPIYINI